MGWKVIIALLILAQECVAQFNFSDQALLANGTRAVSQGGCTAQTNALAVNLLTVRAATAAATFYETASFTASSNAFLFFAETFSPQLGTSTVTNTGTTQLTWWRAATTNYNTIGSPTMTCDLWVTQMPSGTAPFAMTLVALHGSGTGINMIVGEVTGADDTAPYGTNAVVQATSFAFNQTTIQTNQFAAPGNNGKNTLIFVGAHDVNNNTITNTLDWTRLWITNLNTPAQGLSVAYSNNVPALVTTATNQTATVDWATIMLEVKAGTNCQTCDFSTAPAYVQGNTTNLPVVGGVSNAFLNLSGAMTAGNLSVVSIWQDGVAGTVATVSNSVGDVYTLITNIDGFSSAHSLYTYYKSGVTAGSSRIHVIQNTNLLLKVAAHEYSGVTTLDAYQIFTQSSANLASGYTTQTAGRAVLYETFGDSSGFAITPLQGSTTRTTAADERLKTSDRITTCITGAQQASATAANSELWTSCICIFR